jgi:hypothetical protein
LDDGSVAKFQELYLKIGATSELPVVIDKNHQRGIAKRFAYFIDLYKTMYLMNPIVPAHIPFEIVMESFIRYAVQNADRRKGNNQSAILQQFNEWIKQKGVKHQLVALRDERYPDKKPKQLSPGLQRKPIQKFSEMELEIGINQLKDVAKFSQAAKELMNEYQEELEKRNE